MIDDTVPRSSQARWPWLAVIALVSVAALLGVVLLQAQQLQQLGSAVHQGSEMRAMQMHRQETEYLQLREQWQRALDPSTALDQRALALRYDIWVGGLVMLRDDTLLRRTALAALPDLDETLRRVDVFVQKTDAVLAASSTDADRRAALAALQPALLALGEPIHELSLAASHRVSG